MTVNSSFPVKFPNNFNANTFEQTFDTLPDFCYNIFNSTIEYFFVIYLYYLAVYFLSLFNFAFVLYSFYF